MGEVLERKKERHRGAGTGSTHWRMGRNSGKRWRGAQEQRREIAARVLPGTLPVIFIIILVFPFTFT